MKNSSLRKGISYGLMVFALLAFRPGIALSSTGGCLVGPLMSHVGYRYMNIMYNHMVYSQACCNHSLADEEVQVTLYYQLSYWNGTRFVACGWEHPTMNKYNLTCSFPVAYINNFYYGYPECIMKFELWAECSGDDSCFTQKVTHIIPKDGNLDDICRGCPPE